MQTHYPLLAPAEQEARYDASSVQAKRQTKSTNKKPQRIWASLLVLAAVAFFIVGGSIYSALSQKACAIFIDGQRVALLVSRAEAEEALALCLDTEKTALYGETEGGQPLSFANSVRLQEMTQADITLSSVPEAAEALSARLQYQAEAVALVVDGETAAYVANADAAIAAINAAKARYAVAGEDNVSRVYTSERITMADSQVPSSEVKTAAAVASLLTAGTTPRITVNVEREQREKRPLPYQTVRVDNDTMLRGEETLVSTGQDGVQEITYTITEVNGKEISRAGTKATVIVAAVDEVVEYGTQLSVSSRSGTAYGSLLWPLADGVGSISSRFGLRPRDYHTGIDVANEYGTTIVAADAGTVTCAQDRGDGYGNLVILDHGDGLETYYGHCDELLVAEGDTVEKGQAIATVGMTGTTTGPHVHFEVRVDDTPIDPLPYMQQDK